MIFPWFFESSFAFAEINTGRLRERERDEMRRPIVIDSASLVGVSRVEFVV